MAIYNEILAPRYARALQRLFGIKGGVPAKQLSGEIMPVHPIFNGAENRVLEGWDRFGATINVAAGGAGNRSAIRLRNPVGSNVVAVIEKLTVVEFSAADQPILTIASTTADLTTVSALANNRLDNRMRPSPSLVLSSSVNAGAVTGVSLVQTALLTNTAYDFIACEDQELTLMTNGPNQPNGDAYTLWGNTLNQAFIASFIWRERLLEDSEKAVP